MTERSGTAGPGEMLDLLTSDRAAGAGRRWLPMRPVLALAAGLAADPAALPRRFSGLVAELGRICTGRSEVAPADDDGRWRDDAWSGNPAFRALQQSYLAWGEALDGVLDDADLDWQSERRLRFLVTNVVDALAPTNVPQLNPAVLKATLDSGGANLIAGLRMLVRDLSSSPRIPTKVDTEAFTVGEDLAVTPGQVVAQTELIELIHYGASTDEVRQTPVLLVPPMINKYYIADLAPGRSMIEHFVGAGMQCFAISWRNPGAEHAELGLDQYGQAVLDALEVVEEITGAPSAHLLALCAGGIVTAMVVAHLAQVAQQDRVASLTLGVCVLDQDRGGTAGAMIDRTTAAAALAVSARKGYIDGTTLAGVFAWLRPNDLVWRYWVSSYLLGKPPPAFDVLYWNSDSTRMPARLHEDFMRLALENALVTPGKASLLGSSVDLGKVTVDAYVVAAVGDHISPWKDCYATTRLLGSEPRFVLSNSGHIVAMVNPPDNPKASFQTAAEVPADPDAWLAASSTTAASWWGDWVEWLEPRSGDLVSAPEVCGSEAHPPIRPAPGTYVLES